MPLYSPKGMLYGGTDGKCNRFLLVNEQDSRTENGETLFTFEHMLLSTGASRPRSRKYTGRCSRRYSKVTGPDSETKFSTSAAYATARNCFLLGCCENNTKHTEALPADMPILTHPHHSLWDLVLDEVLGPNSDCAVHFLRHVSLLEGMHPNASFNAD